MINIAFAGGSTDWSRWEQALLASAREEELPVRLTPYQKMPSQEVEYLLYAPDSDLQDLRPYAHVKGICSLWAGVDKLMLNPTLPDVPVVRMVEDGMTQGMAEYVLGHVMRIHLRMDHHRMLQEAGMWGKDVNPPLASKRSVGLMGLGTLGGATARLLGQVGFKVSGWSRSPKTIKGVLSFAGPDELPRFLSSVDILVLLIPHTSETTNLLNNQTLGMMRKHAHIINAARGPIIDDTALLRALDEGHLGSATLDAFRKEPLPADHPYWNHPRVTITPHIASVTRVETGARAVIRQIRNHEAGDPLTHIARRDLGY